MIKLIVDFSSIVGAYLHIKDEEFGTDISYKGEDFHIPDTETCMERFIQTVGNLEVDPVDFIVVKDPGGLPRVRTRILPEYKQKPRVQPPEFYDAREKLFAATEEYLKSQGAIFATPKNHTEADDLINEMAKRFPNSIIWTRDKDLLACPADVLLSNKEGMEFNPVKFPVPNEYIHVYRTLVEGDGSDNVGSCKGFGPKAWEKMLAIFGDDAIKDLDEMLRDKELHLMQEYVPQLSDLQKIIDQADELYKIYQVLSFHPVPAHKVKWEGGMLKGESLLVTADNYAAVLDEIQHAKFEYAVIDYEGDTCDESKEWCKRSEVAVDVLGQEITGMGLRIGAKNWYFSVDHADTKNITLDQLEAVLEILWGKTIYCHNVSFENTLTYTHFEALLPNMIDTMLMASYVDEDESQGLKNLSKLWLDYQQTSYQGTLNGRSGMREVPATEVVDYGIDDVITTDALKNLFTAIMQYEGTLEVFHKVENDALYFTTLCFINGVDFDEKRYHELKATNDRNIEETWAKLSEMLLDLDWEGGEFQPVKGMNIGTLNKIHKTVHGYELPDVSSAKMAIKMMDDKTLAKLAEDKDFDAINEYYRKHWKPVAEFNVRSPTQMSKLLYEVLGLPIRIRNSPTAKMKKAGKKGNPTANEAAIMNAIAYKDTKHIELLETLLEYKGYLTKESLFLEKYPKYVSWKDGKIHASLRQSATSTRRFSCSKPNVQQLPKRQGVEFRDMLKAKEGYSFVALDFSGQELRLAADDSRDENFLSCYIGDNKRDPHSLTGLKIACNSGEPLDYDTFVELLNEEIKLIKDDRTIGKKINFTCQYGALAPKVGFTLGITEGEAQKYIDARADAFPQLIQRVKEWHKICKEQKYATTMLGARRHLDGHKYFDSKKEFEVHAAERYAYSMRIQGSAAEQVKLAMGRMYRENLVSFDGDILPCLQIHDELVVQVRDEKIDDVMPTLIEIMCQQYADMIVPMETEPEVGKSLGSLKKYEMKIAA